MEIPCINKVILCYLILSYVSICVCNPSVVFFFFNFFFGGGGYARASTWLTLAIDLQGVWALLVCVLVRWLAWL